MVERQHETAPRAQLPLAERALTHKPWKGNNMLLKPRKKIDPIEVRDLAAVGCTIEEIAFHVKCSDTTLYRRYERVIKEGRIAQYQPTPQAV